MAKGSWTWAKRVDIPKDGFFTITIRQAGKSKSDLLLELSQYVIGRHQKGFTTVLVVDEAHHLSTEVLEEVRLLTNLETGQAKLLQILLVGQQELDDKLDSVDLRQLKQRIALRANLGPLDLDETRGYVYRRMQIAGCSRPAEVFPMETVLELHRQSRGYPRLINTLCENGLIQGYARQLRGITPEMIEEIAADFRLNVVNSSALSHVEPATATEIQRAAKTLLDVYSRLRSSQGSQEGSSAVHTRFGAGASEDEPYI